MSADHPSADDPRADLPRANDDSLLSGKAADASNVAAACDEEAFDAATRETLRLLRHETRLEVADSPQVARIIGEFQRLGGLLSALEQVEEEPAVAAAANRTEPTAPPELAEFRILSRLGAGGMGTVYLAEEIALSRQVALKVIRLEQTGDPLARARFLREARAMAALHHDHVMPIFRVGEFDGGVYLTMPVLAGETLASRLVRAGGPLSEPEVLAIARQIASGLAAIHGVGLVHRDIKPSNLWLESRGEKETPRVRILDLGLARETDRPSDLSATAALLGTPGYMSPEQAAGEPVDARCDLFSLGAVIYEMATGRPAFSGPSIYAVIAELVLRDPPPASQVRPGVSDGLSALTRKLLSKRPGDRPATAAAVEQALGELISSSPSRTSSGGRRWLVLLGAMAIGCGVVITIVLKDGRRYSLDVPDGTRVKVDEHGNSQVELDQTKKPAENAGGATTTAFAPLDPAWAKRFAALSPADQRQELANELRRRNPRMTADPYYSPLGDGTPDHTGIGVFTEEVADITPLAAQQSLRRVQLIPSGFESGERGRLESLEALRGLWLEFVDVKFNPQVRDLAPLAGKRLNWLDLTGTGVDDLAALRETKLTGGLLLERTAVRDLTPIAGQPLVELRLAHTAVQDLSPLEGMKLHTLTLPAGAGPWSVLAEMPLEHLTFSPDEKQDANVFRRMPTLKQINGQPAKDFWRAFDARQP